MLINNCLSIFLMLFTFSLIEGSIKFSLRYPLFINSSIFNILNDELLFKSFIISFVLFA